MNAHTPFDANQDWTNPYCQNSSNDPMVDALLGNAYHVVRTVYCNLGNLKLIYDFLNQYGMVLGVQSEAELKVLTTKATFARIYDKSPAGDRRVTDYLYVEGDRTGILPDDTTATGSWVKVATSGSSGGGGESTGEGAYIPWVFNNGAAVGGETTIRVPDGTIGVPFIIVNGFMNYVGKGFEFDTATLTITLTQPLEEGDEVVCLLTGVPAVPGVPNINNWTQINWLYNNGAAVGGEQVIEVPYTFQDISAVFKNGLRLVKGLTTDSYTLDTENNRFILTEPLAVNDRLVAQIGGEVQVLSVPDHTLEEVARAANVKDSEVILSTNITQSLNGKKVIFSVNEQVSYGLPALPNNVYIQTVANGKLTYNPGSVVVDLLALPGSATELKVDLGKTTGANQVGYGSTTVADKLDSLGIALSDLSDNVSRRVLNIASLRSTIPTAAGELVYLISSYSNAVTVAHVGGGYFQAIDNTAALPDDGGIVVHSPHATLVWKRINVTSYDMQYWGVTANTGQDCAAAITRAVEYAKNNRIILDAPAGSIMTSEMVPLYSNMGIRGQGKAENTVFYKTTNNTFDYKKNGAIVLQVDALVGFVPQSWDLADYEMKSYAVHTTLIGCMFRRYTLSAENVGTISPQYGLFLGKAASSVIRQVNIEGGRIGIKGYNTFSGVMEMVAATQFNGYGYAGVDISDYRNATMYPSGTSMDMRLVQVRGYQFGFEIDRLQYSTLIDCTAEEIGPMSGETTSYAFSFYDPYCISMINCATEFVKGGQIRVQGFANPSFRPQLKVTGFLAIDQQNPVAPTPIYSVANGGSTACNIVIDASELSRNESLTNLTAPEVKGAGAKVILIGCSGEDWVASENGVFTRLA